MKNKPPIRKPSPLSVRIKRKAVQIEMSSAFLPVDVSTSTLRKWAREVAALEETAWKYQELEN
jgi:hypothetical protein